jgi:Uncharacterised protein conserved in bacteria (DUF2336)
MPKFSAYPTLDGLLDLACRDGVDIRPTLLRVLTDLYVQKLAHSAEEEVQYVELALQLIEAVDAETLTIVAGRLSAYPGAPKAVLHKLTGSMPLPDFRPAAHGEPTHSDAKLASERELADLFFTASADERRLILISLDAADAPTVRKLVPTSNDVMRRLEQAALQRNIREFTGMLGRELGITREAGERIVGDASGEPIVVAAKALGMTAAVLQRILLFLNPAVGQSVQRVYDLARLFDEISPASAECMVAIWRQAGGQPRGRHESFTWNDERRGARTLATPLPHRAARRDAPPPQPFKSKGPA